MDGTMAHSNLEGFTFLYGCAEAVGGLAVILITFWMGYYHGGFSWRSDPKTEFNWHPVLMTFGMVFLYGNGIALFRVLRYRRKRQLKIFHASSHIITFVVVVIGLITVFDSHNLNDPPIPNLYSLHSWVGLTAVILFCCQFVVGLTTFLYPGAKAQLRAVYLPVHKFFGLAGFAFAISACLMGLLEKANWVIVDYKDLDPEGILVNIIGLLLIIYGTIIIYVATNENYRRIALTEDEMLLNPGITE